MASGAGQGSMPYIAASDSGTSSAAWQAASGKNACHAGTRSRRAAEKKRETATDNMATKYDVIGLDTSAGPRLPAPHKWLKMAFYPALTRTF
ncbi:hypothetical protein GCM10022228_15040 [Halomonas cibimaris]|uniref:Uncharacterized protein n=1 Tax=Halomonas cibimaris TaxID=657012 RepID=A0ABP7LTT0_9GAMM